MGSNNFKFISGFQGAAAVSCAFHISVASGRGRERERERENPTYTVCTRPSTQHLNAFHSERPSEGKTLNLTLLNEKACSRQTQPTKPERERERERD